MSASDRLCPQCQSDDVRARPKLGDWTCDNCGYAWKPDASVVPSPATGEKVRLFLSYGRRDAKDLADRLAMDLTAKGFAVWQDTREITTGTSWQHEIVDGLRSAQVVIALLSPHSVRTSGDPHNPNQIDSVCLGEISYALFQPPPRPVVPVMAQSCEPPLAIFHLDYVDMRAWTESDDQYQAGLQRLLDGIQAALRGEKRYRNWFHQLDPWDFAAFLYAKRQDFCGRQWLFDRIDAWRTACGRERALLIKGDPGTGKSAIVAELVHRNPRGQVLAYHCCQWDVLETRQPWRFVRSIAAMIASKHDDYAAMLQEPTVHEALSEASCKSDPGSALEKGVLAPLQHLHAPADGPRYLLIDALDESLLVEPGMPTIVDLLASRLDRLPPWLRIVATTRKEAAVLSRLKGLSAEELEAQSAENLADVQEFITTRLNSRGLAEKRAESGLSVAEVVRLLCDKSQGNFLYVQQTLDGIERGLHTLDKLDALPPGLEGLYVQRFQAQFRDAERFAACRRVLDVIVAAREPLAKDELARATGLDSDEELLAVLRRLSAYVPARPGTDALPRYAAYHRSLVDWLTDPERRDEPHSASPKRGHQRLADMGWQEYQRGPDALSPYVLAHLPAHLTAAGRWEDIERLLCDLFYLEAKTQAGRIFELAADFAVAVAALPADRPQRRILRLLEEALRRDIHFIAQHAQDYPQGLFQCLWNSGWWYDSPQAAQHYVEGRPPGSPHTPTKMGLAPITDDRCLSRFRGSGRTPIMMSPCADDGTRSMPPMLKVGTLRDPNRPATVWPDYTLHQLLERWREAKEQVAPSFPWLRALRPPPMHLGSAQQAVLRGHEESVYGVAISPAGDRIVSGSKDETVRVWDARSGAELAVLRGHQGWVYGVAVSPDGDRFVSGSEDATIRVWDARRGAELAVLRGHESAVRSVAVAPGGERIVSGADDMTVRVWDARSGAELAVLRGHESGVRSVAVAPGGERIVSGADDMTVRVWDARNGAELAVLRGHRGWVQSVAISPGGERIVSGANWPDTTVRVWDARSGAEMVVFRGHASSARSVAFSPAGDRIISGSVDKTVRVWDAYNGAELAVLRAHENYVSCVAHFPGGERIVSGSLDRTLRVWDTRNGTELAILRGHENRVVSIEYISNGDRIASGSLDKTVRLWDARNGAELAVLRGHEYGVSRLAISPAEDRIASGSYDNTARVWDARSGMELVVLRGHRGAVNGVAFSPGGERVISWSADRTVRVWGAVGGEELAVLRGHQGEVKDATVSLAGDRIVSGSVDQTVRIWDAFTGEELAVLRGHQGEVKFVAISAEGDRVASASADQTVRVWDGHSGAELAVLRGHQGAVQCVAFSPSGERIVSESKDETVRVWDARSGQCLEVIAGSAKVRALARASETFALRALERGLETVVEWGDTGQPLAWFPVNLTGMVYHASGRVWTGAAVNYLCPIALEGQSGSTVVRR